MSVVLSDELKPITDEELGYSMLEELTDEEKINIIERQNIK